MELKRKFIDWEATGNRLFRLRSDNAYLRKYVCSAIKKNTDKCNNRSGDCNTCEDRYVDRSISRTELAEVFGVSESVINNWETGKRKLELKICYFIAK